MPLAGDLVGRPDTVEIAADLLGSPAAHVVIDDLTFHQRLGHNRRGRRNAQQHRDAQNLRGRDRSHPPLRSAVQSNAF
jgi:hypothetical protein